MTIRRIPEDFVVREVLTSARVFSSSRGARDRYAVYRLSKQSLTTPEAASLLARRLGVRGADVTHAGLKDKHARCMQHVTVAMPTRGTPLQQTADERWDACFLGWTDRPLTAADISHNEFEIVVRDLLPHAAQEMARRANLLELTGTRGATAGRTLAVMNYFGDQRFGSARHGGGFAAQRLVLGDFEGALRLLIGTPARKDTGARRALTRALASNWGSWEAAMTGLPRTPERRPVETLAAGGSFADAFGSLPRSLALLCVEAYQSWLWNAVARTMCELGRASGIEVLTADDDFGAMHFPIAESIPDAWFTAQVPYFSPGLKFAPPWETAGRLVLETEKISLEALRVPGCDWLEFRAVVRPLVIQAQRFELRPPEKDDLGRRGRLKRCLCFSLPRGSYATTLLRALGQ